MKFYHDITYPDIGYDSISFYLAGESTTCTKEEFKEYCKERNGYITSITFDQADILKRHKKTIGYAYIHSKSSNDAESFFFDWLVDDTPNIITTLTVPDSSV